jgi:hypothetical protein
VRFCNPGVSLSLGSTCSGAPSIGETTFNYGETHLASGHYL